jgi:ParB/RepB/Spo0J family partition protein
MSTEEAIVYLPIDRLHESPFNYRKRHSDQSLAELAEDIKAHGRVLSPLLVRPRTQPLFAGDPDGITGHELVFGHRRFRAAQLAGLAEVPCMVRAMTDEEAKKAQISENLQREDVHPIEEAEGFQALIDDHGLTADLIAEQQGKSRSYVYGRLKLLAACPQIRKACLDGEIGSEVALLIARLRTPKLQEKALSYIKGKAYDLEDGGSRSYRHIRDLLNERFTLDLKSAMFDVEDEMLLPEAGHCMRCPKRSGNAPEYVDIVEGTKERHWSHTNFGADVCTDPDCFDAKKKAHLKREAAKLAEKGAVVVDGNKARAAIDASGRVKGAYIALKDVQAELKKAKKGAAAPAVVVIQDPRSGKTVKAVLAADVKAAGIKVKEATQGVDWQARQKRDEEQRAERQAKADQEQARRVELLKRVREAMAATERSAFDFQWVVRAALAGVPYRDRAYLCELWGAEDSDQLDERVPSMSAGELTTLALDCALVAGMHVEYYSMDSEAEALNAAAEHYGVASTPSPAARAPKKAKAAAGAKKAKPVAKGPEEQGEEQTDDAGFAGGSDAETMEDAGA